MEIGELVNISVPEQADEQCPFSHDPPNETEKNELGGLGSTLGKNLAAGVGTSHESRKDGDFLKSDKDLDPRYRPGKEMVKRVTITVNGEIVTGKGDRPLQYPLTCAAHHLIPAQESLKGHSVLKYMCKKGEAQDFRNGKKSAPKAVGDSKVWGNVAYNVNGAHNGVWLPGNYAVGGGKGGAAIWAEKASARRNRTERNEAWIRALDLSSDDWERGDDDEEEAETVIRRTLRLSSAAEYMLAGKNHHIDPGNPKWAYVMASMDAAGSQFHDRHEDYSNVVKDYLDKIAALYKTMHTRSQTTCKQCKKASRPTDATDSEVGPPFGIIVRLNNGSAFFKGYLTSVRGRLGTRKGRKIVTARNIYTSAWVHNWLEDAAQTL